MHMADALISATVGVTMYAASAGGLGYSTLKLRKEGQETEKVPMMAVTGAFVFAAQMINFTIPGTGSSGHIGGGILLAGVLGGPAALITLAAVLLVQCLFFADGGLLALGCNIFNMGLIPCLLVYPLIFKPMLVSQYNKRKNAVENDGKFLTKGRIAAASIISVVVGLQLGAFGVVLETLASGITSLPFSKFVLAMQPIHLAIGIVEGIVTAAVVNYVYAVRPAILYRALGVESNVADSINEESVAKKSYSVRKLCIIFLVLTALVGGGLSLFASAFPDGLEWSMERVAGTAELETEENLAKSAAEVQEKTAFMPDYDYKESGVSAVSGTTVAGLVGGAITCILAGILGFMIKFIRKKTVRA